MYNISQIAGFGHMEDEETSAMGGLLSYIEMTQMGIPKLEPIGWILQPC